MMAATPQGLERRTTAATSTIEERRLTVLGRLREQRGRLEKAL